MLVAKQVSITSVSIAKNRFQTSIAGSSSSISINYVRLALPVQVLDKSADFKLVSPVAVALTDIFRLVSLVIVAGMTAFKLEL